MSLKGSEIGVVLALSSLVAASALSERSRSSQGTRRARATVGRRGSNRRQVATVLAARRLNRAAGTLAASVLADSGIEHYRGSFKNKAMFTPLVVSAITLAMSLHGTSDMRPVAHRARDTSYILAAATGLLGTGFHLYNVGKKVGGFSWQNVFYGAPLGAPVAILLSGLLGFCSERIRESRSGEQLKLFRASAARTVAAVTAAGLLGTSGEAGLLHFRGAYHNPFMALPVTLPPIGAILLFSSAATGRARIAALARWWMRLLAVMGFVGTGFHAYGVSRNMGGWCNWSQNILSGPPLPAPPSFSGLALAGLAALGLMKERRDA